MDALIQLWLPVLCASAAVWILSSIAWTLLPHHRKDFSALPHEEALREWVKGAGIPPGNYHFPHMECGKDSSAEARKKLWESGPVGILTLWGKVSMGRNMFLSFLIYLATSVVIAYLATLTLEKGAPFMKVFRVLGTAGVLAYCFAFLPQGVWFGSKTRAMAGSFVDGIAYGLATGAIFAAFWPAA